MITAVSNRFLSNAGTSSGPQDAASWAGLGCGYGNAWNCAMAALALAVVNAVHMGFAVKVRAAW
jgi:hypothetical protein